MFSRMIKTFLLCLSLFAVHRDSVDALQEIKITNVFESYKQLLVDIREEKISPFEAQRTFQAIMVELHEKYPTQKDSTERAFIFPLRGMNWRSIGGKNGSGYFANHYDLFDATKKGSHPAHDIFIKDRNQDCIDERTNNYVDILSLTDAMVLAVETDWQPNSDYRGGNYVWTYDLRTGGLWYYAHQRQVIVQAGQMVKAGEKLGEVGRTGFNAYQKRSETHLHLTYLSIDEDNLPHPINTYKWLKEAETRYNGQ